MWLHIRIRLHEVLLPIYHKNYNFREKKNNQGMKEKEKLQNGLICWFKLQLLMWLAYWTVW